MEKDRRFCNRSGSWENLIDVMGNGQQHGLWGMDDNR